MLSYNIHRAGGVYQGRVAAVVNPPTPEVAIALRGSSTAVLDWALDGFELRSPLDTPATTESLAASLRAQGLSEALIEQMLSVANQGGVATPTSSADSLDDERRSEALDEALSLAYATADGRVLLSDLLEDAAPGQKVRYQEAYPAALRSAGLAGVDLLTRFPVLTAMYGFTRGDHTPKGSRLRWFKDQDGGLQAHGTKMETEALLFRLDPLAVARYLEGLGLIHSPSEERDCRLSILSEFVLPEIGEIPDTPTVGSAILELVHSYAHRVIRHLAAFAGIDRDSLSEVLAPRHLGFIIYAQSRGFVLGGLQALYEHDLDAAIEAVVHSERRCPLDPGCSAHNSACVACLHVGEPSCRWFNTALSRESLFGPRGYLSDMR
jgi:hypothetical protein